MWVLQEHLRGKVLSQELGIQVHANSARFVEQAYFILHVIERESGISSSDPVFTGVFSTGRPSQSIQGWVDGDYFDKVVFRGATGFSLSESGLDIELFKILGGLVPPGGSMMVSYSLYSKESQIHKDTRLGLDRGYPPAVTPLGFLLFVAGCGMGFKDWYFAEGGREGPEKLQGYKPINLEVAKRKAEMMLLDITRFGSTSHEEKDSLARACRFRAEYVMRELKNLI